MGFKPVTIVSPDISAFARLFGPLSVSDAVSSLRHCSGLEAEYARDVVRAKLSKTEPSTLVYEFLLHLLTRVENHQQGIDEEILSLTESLRRLAMTSKDKALVSYSDAWIAYSGQEPDRLEKAMQDLLQAVKHLPWYSQMIPSFEAGIAADKALADKDYVRLLYLMLHEAERVEYESPASTWLLSAIENHTFSAWLLRCKKLPKAPTGCELPEDYDTQYLFNKLQVPGHHQWRVGIREILCALELAHSGTIGKKTVFENIASTGDVVALRHFYSPETFSKKGAAAMRNAAGGGHRAAVEQCLQWGVSQAILDSALLEVIFPKGGFSPEVFTLLLNAGANPNKKKSSEQMRKGKVEKHHTTRLQEAARRGNFPAVRMLLDAGADPSIVDEEGKTALDIADSPAVAKVLREFSPKKNYFSVGEARNYIRDSSLSRPDKKKLEAQLKKVGDDDAPMRMLLNDPSEMNRWAKAFVGIETSTRQEKSLEINEQSVVESSLEIKGRLLITNHVLVLGNVSAQSIDIGEGGSLAVCGTTEALDIYCGGFLFSGEDIKTRLLSGFDGGTVYAPTLHAELSVLYAYCSLNTKCQGGQHFNFEHGIDVSSKAFKKAEKIIVKEALSSDDDDFGFDLGILSKRAISGKSLLR